MESYDSCMSLKEKIHMGFKNFAQFVLKHVLKLEGCIHIDILGSHQNNRLKVAPNSGF